LVRSENPLLRGQSGVLLTIAKAEQALLVFDERLAALVTQLQRTVLDAPLLHEAIAAVRSETAASQVLLEELLLLPPPERIEVAVCQTDLLLVIKNLLRNAITAVGKSPLPHRIAIDVVLQLLPTGEELVRLRVHDTAESVLSLEQLTERSALGQRGLDLVRTTLRLYGGALALDAGLPGYTKCVVAQLFRVLAAEAATSADSQAEKNVDA
jgi:signal transduction histidine kinase